MKEIFIGKFKENNLTIHILNRKKPFKITSWGEIDPILVLQSLKTINI